MWPLLILLFVVLPFVELVLLIELGRSLGLPETLGLVILTGVTGAALARSQGFRAVQRIRQALRENRLPATEVVDGFMIFAAGLLLITPGLITDSVGFALLIPRFRAVLRRRGSRFLRGRVTVTENSRPRSAPKREMRDESPGDDVIDVEAEVLPDDCGRAEISEGDLEG